ncbi:MULTISPECIES: phosphatase PAP2 family protein [unclassified Rhodococcus (in: high G+C Gram-positive bacteria)]|uniref:phosphatase PAP2 family protein n=1 Tax=unclassified Rhodococcus (in: high G+C Gram-positive bacteria) TaxID=192944 RepID=UPI0006F8BC25|nr:MULTISPECIES: phosphatase PAP2 family protein [unclassified Rhodococcus (in: high G+C Gram-positive bacteria)]KQU39275.1 hypothetical protein ASG69_12500 [Rhodococcus sp. Leaf225]KQU43711.1 hypothetical protein ASH03_14175 [Rhodococcus sp. Leaf258]
MSADRDVLDWMVDHRSAALTDAMTVITTVGNTAGVALVTVVVALILVRRGHRHLGPGLVATVFTGWLVMNALKYAIRRTRPPVPERLVDISTYSFPSGHAMVSATFAAAVITLLVALDAFDSARKRTRAAAAVVTAATLLIGFSRVYLGAHWLSDVVVGWLLGALVGVAGIAVVSRLSGRAGR